ncbi:MAG: pyridoxamine 5'-phosphate oxidase family protein [Tannerellaceae bacterium]|nr:pyridoxamine 5'-phosphate oxidase family protein [Tannerellaceae bacterium]
MKRVILFIFAMAGFTIGAVAQTNLKGNGDMQEVHDFLKKCGHYFIATTEGDQPRVRPFGTVHIFEGKLYIQTGKAKKVAKQIKANPKIEICAFNGADQWIRIQAVAVEDDRREAKESMLEAYPSLKGMYSADDDNTLVLYLKDVVAYLSSFSAEPRVIKF